jgi:hypothetical protein
LCRNFFCRNFFPEMGEKKSLQRHQCDQKWFGDIMTEIFLKRITQYWAQLGKALAKN